MAGATRADRSGRAKARQTAPTARRMQFGGPTDPPDLLVLADNQDYLPGLADQSLDLIYIDPPFGTGSTRQSRAGRYQDPGGDPDAFTEWLLPCLSHSHRLLRPTGSLFVHLDYRTVHYVKVALDRLFGAEALKNEIIWCYSVGGKSRRTFGRKHDTILWYARSAKYIFDADAVRIARKPRSHMRVVQDPDGNWVQEKTDRKTGRVYRYPVAAGKIPEDWWTDIETLNRGDRERTGWPTQKPERLLERIIAAASRPGDWVADWFAGSGTTAVVAQRLGRRFIAVDRSPEALQVAGSRLLEAGTVLAKTHTPPPDIERLSQADLPRFGPGTTGAGVQKSSHWPGQTGRPPTIPLD